LGDDFQMTNDGYDENEKGKSIDTAVDSTMYQ
jgi:hypothetical protein